MTTVSSAGDCPQGPTVSHPTASASFAGMIALGKTVTAEGVESPDQANLLRDMGCPGAQGWLYSKAVPADEATRLLDHVYPHI